MKFIVNTLLSTMRHPKVLQTRFALMTFQMKAARGYLGVREWLTERKQGERTEYIMNQANRAIFMLPCC